MSLLLFDVTAKLESHGGEQLVSEVFLASRCEPLVKRGAQDRSRSPSSMAGVIVQRPSPESDTRPENLERSGCPNNAMAVRSSSHDATTLPRRQTSATSPRLKSY